MKALCFVIVALLATTVLADDQTPVTLESAPPVVVKTVPAAGSDDVDPNLSEISVTFSKKMRDGSWSWVQMSQDSFPIMRGKPRYVKDGRTNVLGVTLKPNHTYAIWFNSDKFRNFTDAEGRPVVPYLLVFKTRPAINDAPALDAKVGRDGSKVRFLTDGDTTTIDITSEFGIDKATIRRKADAWPKSVSVRLHLRGLESFKATSGDVAVEWSVSSTSDNPSQPLQRHEISYKASGEEEKTLDDEGRYFTEVRVVADEKKIPLKGGYFEVPLPTKLFEANPQEITLEWIDFYRN